MYFEIQVRLGSILFSYVVWLQLTHDRPVLHDSLGV